MSWTELLTYTIKRQVVISATSREVQSFAKKAMVVRFLLPRNRNEQNCAHNIKCVVLELLCLNFDGHFGPAFSCSKRLMVGTEFLISV